MKILRYFVALLVLTCLLSTATLATFVTILPEGLSSSKTSSERNEKVDTTLNPGTYNILCVGIDKEETNADTIVLLSFDSINKKLNLLSIPRDTMSNAPRVVKKINASYGEGGIENTIKEVQMLTSLPIDRYVVTNFDGFEHVIDALGGIDMNVPEDLSYQDTQQDLYINLPAGQQHLDGKTALHFVRFRYGYASGDIGRVGAQQLFFKALAEKLTSKNILTALPAMAETVKKDMKTDLTTAEMLWFAKEGLKVNLDTDVHMFLLPGSAQTIDGLSYYLPSQQGILAMLNKHFFVKEDNQITPDKLDLVPIASSVAQDYLTEGDKPVPTDENNIPIAPAHSYNPYNPTPVETGETRNYTSYKDPVKILVHGPLDTTLPE